jgi:hypothetical protein
MTPKPNKLTELAIAIRGNWASEICPDFIIAEEIPLVAIPHITINAPTTNSNVATAYTRYICPSVIGVLKEVTPYLRLLTAYRFEDSRAHGASSHKVIIATTFGNTHLVNASPAVPAK